MATDRTNLLPQGRQRSLGRDYLFRLLTVATLGVSALVIVHGLLLFPTYLYLEQEVNTREAKLEALKAASALAAEGEVGTRIDTLTKAATQLSSLANRPTGSGTVRAVLSVPRPGITLSSFAFAPAEGGESKMVISGSASTRAALRTYRETLDALPYVTKADLPISAYAKETDIGFAITLTGTLLP